MSSHAASGLGASIRPVGYWRRRRRAGAVGYAEGHVARAVGRGPGRRCRRPVVARRRGSVRPDRALRGHVRRRAGQRRGMPVPQAGVQRGSVLCHGPTLRPTRRWRPRGPVRQGWRRVHERCGGGRPRVAVRRRQRFRRRALVGGRVVMLINVEDRRVGPRSDDALPGRAVLDGALEVRNGFGDAPHDFVAVFAPPGPYLSAASPIGRRCRLILLPRVGAHQPRWRRFRFGEVGKRSRGGRGWRQAAGILVVGRRCRRVHSCLRVQPWWVGAGRLGRLACWGRPAGPALARWSGSRHGSAAAPAQGYVGSWAKPGRENRQLLAKGRSAWDVAPGCTRTPWPRLPVTVAARPAVAPPVHTAGGPCPDVS